MVHSVERQTLGSGSGGRLGVVGWSPASGSAPSRLESLSPSAPPPRVRLRSQIIFKKKKKRCTESARI